MNLLWISLKKDFRKTGKCLPPMLSYEISELFKTAITKKHLGSTASELSLFLILINLLSYNIDYQTSCEIIIAKYFYVRQKKVETEPTF